MTETSSDPPVVTPDVSVNVTLYGLASLVYLYIIYNKPDDNKLLSKVLYLLSVLCINIYLMRWLMSKQCYTSINLGWIFGGSILTWILLFVPMFWLLENMYVWLQPFGNTFGYLFIKIMGVTSFMDRILNNPDSDGRINKYINYIRSEPWGFFSMLTTNADAKPDILQANNAFTELKDKLNKDEYTEINRAEFISYVRMKELVAKFVFYLLTLNLMTDITAVFLMEKSPCEANDEDNNGNGNGNGKSAENDNKTIYKTTE
jgi:hypothetical protein